MKERVHITTIDNPFNPFEDFASWYDFDMEKGYCSCQRVARLANITDDMTDLEEEAEIERFYNDYNSIMSGNGEDLLFDTAAILSDLTENIHNQVVIEFTNS